MNLLKQSVLFTLTSFVLVASVFAGSENQNSMNGMNKSAQIQLDSEKGINVKKMPLKEDGIIMSQREWKAMQPRVDRPQVETLNRVTTVPNTRDELLFESFETAVPPDGWTLVDHNGGGYGWEQNATQASDGSFSAYCNDYSGDQATELVSPSIDLSGFSSASLTFWQYQNWGSYYNYHDITVYLGGVAYAATELGAGTEDTWEEVVFDLSEFVDESNLQIGFNYSGNWADQWWIDGVTISGSAETVTYGCTDETACNYDETATDDDGSCTYAENGFDCEGNCEFNALGITMNDSYGDGWSGNILTVGDYSYTLESGNTGESGACLEDGLYMVTCDGGTWQSEVSWVISDANGDTLLADGAPYSGSLTLGEAEDVPGCMDETACNYDETATVDDGSCTYPDYGFDCDGNCDANLLEVSMYDSWGDGWNGNILTIGDFQYTLAEGDTAEAGACLSDGLYDVTCDGGSFQYEVSWEIATEDGTVLLDGGAPYSGMLTVGETADVPGCMDETAANYNPEATIDDGSCVWSGDVCEYPLQAVAGSNEATGADQWFAYTATLTGTITVSSAGSGTDTKVWAYSDCETALGSDDDGLGFPPGESELTFDVTSGTDYHIMWDDQWGPDPFTWTLSEEEYATAPNLTATGIPGAVQLAWDDVPTRHSAEHSGPAVSLFTNLDPTISAQKRALLPQNDHSFLNPGHESGVRSTDVVIVCDGGAWQGEVSWEIFNADGDTVAAGGAPDTVEASLDDGVYMVYAHDSYGDGWNGNVLSVTGTDGNVYLSYTLDSGLEGEASFTISSTAVYGCTDNTATNYGQNCAGEDVGTPTIDDGCCVYPPPANDDCEDAESVTGPYPADISGTTVDATISYPGVLDFVDVWYAVDLPHDFNSVTLSLCNSPQAIGNTLVVAYTSCDDASVNNSISYNTLAWYECENISYAPTLNWTIPGPGTAYIPVYTGGPMDFAGTVDVQEIYVPTFNLYRGGESLASGIAGNDYTDEDVTGGMEYCYTVEQNLPDGSVSGMSDEACATPDAEITEGETLADAIMIDALPYVTTNNSSFYVNDYDESCP
ncbi:MAG: hypothetical protein QF769_05300, partial [Candidatus Marinimicrobia bacterium]|nr:hypothetical protein [Candidatus Neomarinimicrobiota bacterium]